MHSRKSLRLATIIRQYQQKYYRKSSRNAAIPATAYHSYQHLPREYKNLAVVKTREKFDFNSITVKPTQLEPVDGLQAQKIPLVARQQSKNTMGSRQRNLRATASNFHTVADASESVLLDKQYMVTGRGRSPSDSHTQNGQAGLQGRSEDKRSLAKPKTAVSGIQGHSLRTSSSKEILNLKHPLKAVPAKSHTSRRHLASNGARDQLKNLNRNLKVFNQQQKAKEKEPAVLKPITPPGKSERNIKQQSAANKTSASAEFESRGLKKVPTADELKEVYLKQAASGLHQKLKERVGVPIVDPLRHGEIIALLYKISRDEQHTAWRTNEPSPDKLTEQVGQLLQPVEQVKISKMPYHNKAITNRPTVNQIGSSLTDLKLKGKTLRANKQVTLGREEALAQQLSTANLLATATRVGKHVSSQRLKKKLLQQSQNQRMKQDVVVVDQSEQIQHLYDNMTSQQLDLRIVPLVNNPNRKVSQPRQQSQYASQRQLRASRHAEMAKKSQNELIVQSSSGFVDPIIAQASKTSTEGWLNPGAESEVMMDQLLQQDLQTQKQRQHAQVRDYLKLREKLERPWRNFVGQSQSMQQPPLDITTDKHSIELVSQKLTLSPKDVPKLHFNQKPRRKNQKQQNGLVVRKAYLSFFEHAKQSKRSQKNNASPLTAKKASLSHDSFIHGREDSSVSFSSLEAHQQQQMKVSISFKSNYEENNAKLGRVKSKPVLELIKAKNEEMQRELGFLKALNSIDI